MAEVNPLSDDFRNNREAVFRQLRDHAPVLMTDQGVAVISRYADVSAAARDPEAFSSGGPWSNPARPLMNTMDPPEHGVYVNLMKSAFDMTYQAGLENGFRSLARRLVSTASAGSECDLMTDVVTPYLVGANGLILGLTAAQADELHAIDGSAQRIGTGEPQEGPGPQERSDALFSAVLAHRREHPGQDHVSALLAVGSDGGRALTEIEMLEYLFRFSLGNGVTTAAAIGNGVELLARHPEQRRMLAADPSLIPGAFEEMQRREGPTHDSTRVTTREVTVAGVTLPAGTPTRLLWGSSNLDERQFADPESFDVRRDASSHLAMGIGEHFCFAAYLARLEARILFEELLRGMPDFTPSGPPVRVTSLWSWGFESIPVSIP